MGLLTADQRINIKANTRFQNLFRSAIYAEANYHRATPGTGLSEAETLAWAKRRIISQSIIQYPTSMDFSAWLEQAYIVLAGLDVGAVPDPYDEETVITNMQTGGKFTELAGTVLVIRMQKVEF